MLITVCGFPSMLLALDDEVIGDAEMSPKTWKQDIFVLQFPLFKSQ